MSRRRGARSVTSAPPIEIRPAVASSSPAIIRSRVVFPHPDGPTKTMNSPSSTPRSTLSTATTPPEKCFETCSSRMSAIPCNQYQTFAAGTTGIDQWPVWYYTPRMAAEWLEGLVTESRSENAGGRDLEPTLELVRRMKEEDSTVASAGAREAPVLARLIDAVVERLARGGRLVYVGAGTSGRLAA